MSNAACGDGRVYRGKECGVHFTVSSSGKAILSPKKAQSNSNGRRVLRNHISQNGVKRWVSVSVRETFLIVVHLGDGKSPT